MQLSSAIAYMVTRKINRYAAQLISTRLHIKIIMNFTRL